MKFHEMARSPSTFFFCMRNAWYSAQGTEASDTPENAKQEAAAPIPVKLQVVSVRI